ncbi:subtype A tannase [Olsenella sp. Marseille-QA0557]|uniref:subtype A tannase n=1 Tax=Olsenella sp. Marseille-QA0557 TaxID=3378782 RepID=UPI003D120A91
MKCSRREFLTLASTGALAALAGCASENTTQPSETDQEGSEKEQVDVKKFEALKIDNSAWNYDDDNDVWWQNRLTYCLEPASETYEQLAIYVPGPYFTGEQKGQTWTCTINENAEIAGFTPRTAPIVMPLNPGDYAGQAASTAYSYDGLGTYLEKGLVYVYAGFRGRNSGYDSVTNEFFSGGAPWGAADVKAAVRFLRYNASFLPCDTSRIITFGHSGGGGLSAVLGTSGDAPEYEPYLNALGAITYDADANKLSDALFGSMCWCPSTSFEVSDAGYEWFAGQYSVEGARADGTWTKRLSDDLASNYAGTVANLGLTSEDGTALTLDETSGGIFVAGTYYDYLVSIVEEGANAFFEHVQFPYTPDTTVQANGNFPGDGNLKAAEEEAIARASGSDESDAGGQASQPVTYANVDAYIDALNGNNFWISYNARRASASITDLGSYVSHCRPANASVAAFDSIDCNQPANQLFGNDDNDALHFDGTILSLLTQNVDTYAQLQGWKEEYLTDWENDLSQKDSLDVSVAARVQMYDPLYYLCGSSEAYGKASVAPHWRINTGLMQTTVPLTTEANLVAALKAYDGVNDVAFTPVWGAGRSLAERSGTPEDNFIAWVEQCCGIDPATVAANTEKSSEEAQ